MSARVFHLIPHTHWDREWYHDRAGFLARLVPMMDSALGTLAAQPDTPFLLDGQAVILRDYLDVRPDAAPRVRALCASGRLQAGPWYVLADELVPSGESLIRNLLLGQRECAALGGRLPVLYSPDAFGHPAELPVLAREFGLSGAVLWRGRRGARDLFRWQSADGSEVCTYHLPRDGYEVGTALPSDPVALARAWPAVREELVCRASGRHVAVPVGADHHGLRDDLPALRDALQVLEAPNEVRLSRLDEFLAQAREGLSLPVERGELRSSEGHAWSLQGVHGTRLPLKRLNALAEVVLERIAEPLAALVMHARRNAPAMPLLITAWRAVLESQFHDTICGTVSDRAALEAELRLDSALTVARACAHEAVRTLARVPTLDPGSRPDEGTLVLWNPRTTQAGGVTVATLTRFRRDILVGPPGARRARQTAASDFPPLADDNGTPLEIQVLGRRRSVERIEQAGRYPDADLVDIVRIAVAVPDMPGLAVATGRPGRLARRRAKPGASVRRGVLANRHLRLAPRSDASVDLLLPDGTVWPLCSLWTEPDAGDCYTAEVPAGIAPSRIGAGTTWRPLAGGPLLAALEGRFASPDLTGRILLELRRDERVIRLRLDLDNRGSARRVRLRVPVPGAASALAGSAFGAVRRRRVNGAPQWAEEARVATAPAQRFVAAAGPTGGMAVLAPGHVEYELDERGDLWITLLRSVGELSRDTLGTRHGHAAWPTPTPGAQCHGATSMSLALAPVSGAEADDPAALCQRWEEAFLGPVAAWFRGALLPDPSPLRIELVGHGMVTSAITPCWNGTGIVLRALNLGEEPVDAAWHLTPMPGRAWRARADESRLGEVAVAGSAIPFEAGPHELVSIIVE